MERYRIVGHISAGAHGVILKAMRNGSSPLNEQERFLAIKRLFIKNRDKNLPLALVREIKSLQLLNGENNIIPLYDVFAHGSSVNLVFPLLPLNLTTLIYEHQLTSYQKAAYVWQLLNGISYCHENGIVHRDLKPSNLLIDWDGTLKVCDFGQSRPLRASTTSSEDDSNGLERVGKEEEEINLSHQVCTRWYRAPELLYGSNSYGYAVDMWSLGCIIGEVQAKQPLFRGESDIEQLCLVVKRLGDPSESWAQDMPDYNKITFTVQRDDDDNSNLTNGSSDWLALALKETCDINMIDLVRNLCAYEKRLTAKESLRHPFLAGLSERGVETNLLVKPSAIKQMVGPPRALRGKT